jgi:acyl-CoA dehydrogenase
MTTIDATKLETDLDLTDRSVTPLERTGALLATLRRRRLLSVLAPQELGGQGLSLGETARLVERVAAQDGSLGLLYAMHLSQLACLARHRPAEGYLTELLREAVDKQFLIASATSEVGTKGDVLRSLCSIEPDGERGLIAKDCANISYLEHADVVLVSANGAKHNLVAVRKGDMTMSERHEQGFMGLEGLSNARYKLLFRFPNEAVFDDDLPTISRMTMTPVVFVLWAATWAGLAGRAIATAKRHLAGGKAMPEPTTFEPIVDLSNRLFQIKTMTEHCANTYDRVETGRARWIDESVAYNRLKVIASEMAPGIIIDAMKLIGTRAYARHGEFSLAQPLADALSAPVMVPNALLRASIARFEPYLAISA